jgi:hypothetical protein
MAPVNDSSLQNFGSYSLAADYCYWDPELKQWKIVWFHPLPTCGFQLCFIGNAALSGYGTAQIQWEIAWPTTTLPYFIPNGWSQSYQFMKFGYCKLSWDPGILALLCFSEFFAQAVPQDETWKGQPLVWATSDSVATAVNGKIKESQVPCDPGGLTFHRLGVKPIFMEGGLSATPLYTKPGPDGGLPTARLWATQNTPRTTNTRRGCTEELAWTERKASAWTRLGVACSCSHLLPLFFHLLPESIIPMSVL